MTQHYQRNVSRVLHWCPTCNRKTMHRVDDRRLGSCTEHQAEGLSKKQEKAQKEKEAAEKQPVLF